jgi:hypothetical protein
MHDRKKNEHILPSVSNTPNSLTAFRRDAVDGEHHSDIPTSGVLW